MVKAIRNHEHPGDDLRGKITYELENGQWLTVNAMDVQLYGLEKVLGAAGVKASDERVPVFQSGKRIGTLPGMFEPMTARTTSFMYQIRGGDFTRTSDGWLASPTLCPGDFECIPEFQWRRDG